MISEVKRTVRKIAIIDLIVLPIGINYSVLDSMDDQL